MPYEQNAPITVAVCTMDRADLLEALLRRLLPQIAPYGNRKLVVVDSSRDSRGAGEKTIALYPRGRVEYCRGTGSGLAAARNQALRSCTTPFIAYIDDDAVPLAGWLDGILAAFSAYGRACAIVGGPVEPDWLVPRPAWLPDELLPYLSVLNLGATRRELGPGEDLYGTNIAYRVSVFLESGVFRTDLGRTSRSLGCNEETELQDRVLHLGKKVVYSPAVAVQHKIPARRLTRRWIYERVFWQAVSDYLARQEPSDELFHCVERLQDQCPSPDHPVPRHRRDTNEPQVFLENCRAVYRYASSMIRDRDTRPVDQGQPSGRASMRP